MVYHTRDYTGAIVYDISNDSLLSHPSGGQSFVGKKRKKERTEICLMIFMWSLYAF